MPEIIRTKERYRDDYASDDEKSSSYGRPSKSGGYKTVKTYRVTPGRALAVEDIDDDRRSMRSDRLEVGTRSSRLEVSRQVERGDRIERPRSALEYRDTDRARETTRALVYERERPRDRDREPLSARSWERDDGPWERERETRETDVVRVKRSHRDREEEPVEYERVSRETEYYGPPEPAPQPIVIRERPEPQKIIVEAAPPQQKYEMVRREEIIENREVAPPRRQEEESYYRRDVREVQPRRDEIARYDRRRRSSSDDYSDSEVYVRKEKRVVRSRSRSHSPRHKLHLAEGALAGAGAAALLANHRDKSGQGSEHRGRKVAGGAAIGALGAELITRARSRYRDGSRERDRSRSSSRGHDHHTKLKTGLALAATALAAAAAGKYISSRNERKEEAARGRSRTRSVSRSRRYSSDEAKAALSKHKDPKHRAATMAKIGAGAAAVAGAVEHFRSKSRGRSKSRLRTGGIIAATGVAGAALAGVYEARKAKQDATAVEDAHRVHRSRSHSGTRSLDYSDPIADPEQGMVQYGTSPIHSGQRDSYDYDPAATAADRSRQRRSSHSGSRSRVRDIASGALATGAAAIGMDQYKKRRERKAAERERRSYEEDASRGHYRDHEDYEDDYSPSPPHTSGGAYFPENNHFAPHSAPQASYPQYPADSVPNFHDYPQHAPYDQASYPPYGAPEVHGPQNQAPAVNSYGYQAPREARDGGNPV